MNIDAKTMRPVRWDGRLKEWRFADVDERYKSPVDGVSEGWETAEECEAADRARGAERHRPDAAKPADELVSAESGP